MSRTLYTLYINDLPSSETGCSHVVYADDITHVIASPCQSIPIMILIVEREIERINKFERKWKIQTSEEKFKIIPIAQHKTQIINVNYK